MSGVDASAIQTNIFAYVAGVGELRDLLSAADRGELVLQRAQLRIAAFWEDTSKHGNLRVFDGSRIV